MSQSPIPRPPQWVLTFGGAATLPSLPTKNQAAHRRNTRQGGRDYSGIPGIRKNCLFRHARGRPLNSIESETVSGAPESERCQATRYIIAERLLARGPGEVERLQGNCSMLTAAIHIADRNEPRKRASSHDRRQTGVQICYYKNPRWYRHCRRPRSLPCHGGFRVGFRARKITRQIIGALAIKYLAAEAFALSRAGDGAPVLSWARKATRLWVSRRVRPAVWARLGSPLVASRSKRWGGTMKQQGQFFIFASKCVGCIDTSSYLPRK